MLAFVWQCLLAGIGLSFIISSLFLFRRNPKFGIAALLAGTLLLRLFMAQLDPFLNLWDERYHALVAKNMMLEPFKPMLYLSPVMPYNLENWAANHVWLHKQPLFLWQIALFYKLFGVNEFVLRLPSVLMLTGVVYFIYRIGSIMVHAKAGFYGAWLFALSFYSLELCSGAMSMEHNDAAFLFYSTASIWGWVEYQNSGKKFWLLIIGLTSGCAILVKWLTGLLVYSGWGLSLLADPATRFRVKAYLPLIFSLFISVLVFLPWQLYISSRFPAESAYEYAYNTRHIFEAVEGHGGTVWFHVLKLPYLYNPVIAWLIPLALLLFFRNLKTTRFRVAYYTWVLFVYLFFSIVVASKLPTYVYLVAPLIFLALGSFIADLELFISKFARAGHTARLVSMGLLLLTGWFTLDLNRIWFHHSVYNYYGEQDYRERRTRNLEVYKSLPDKLKGEPHVVFNCKRKEQVELMYYSGYTGYDYNPGPEDIRKLKAQQIKIAVFDDGNLPEYIKNDSEIVKITDRLL